MANDNDRLTQSPRALRDSTNDPEKHSHGSVQTTQREPSRRDGINDGAWKHQGDRYEPKY
jgi:hypothetical protein